MSNAAERFIDAILASEPPEMITQMARQTLEEKTRNALQRRRVDCLTRQVPCDGSEDIQPEMSLEDFISDAHADLDREIDESAEVLNERSHAFLYNSLPKIHRTLTAAGFKRVQSNNRIHHYHHNETGQHVVASWAGYKLRLPRGQIVIGRHYKHLDKHLNKYSQR
jgi:hypothetical protein